MSLTLAREIAYDAFNEVMENRKAPTDVLQDLYADRGKNLKRLDRNFIKEIVYGSLRWYSKIYWILQHTSKRNLDDSPASVRTALICGTYQIYYMDKVPDRAAVNESVEFVRKKGQANACSFVNGNLRQIARRAEYFAKPDKEKKPVEYLALQFSHPEWIVKRWSLDFRFEKLEAMLAANNHPPPYTVRINTLKTPTEKIQELQSELLRKERTHTDKRNLRCALHFKEAPNVDEGSLFTQGHYTIQDESSQLITFLVDPHADETIIDACAGPGGKLSHMFEKSAGNAKLIAIDRSKIQFSKAQDTISRLEHEGDISWHNCDFLEFEATEKVDKVLLDAPCTGLGVLRRHPEGKWHKDAASIAKLASKQRDLITHALKQLKAGGALVFSVCSFEPEESSQQLAWLQETYGDKITVDTPVAFLPDYYKRYVTRNNLLHVYAGNQDQMDGFSAFRVKLNQEV